jgi:ATP-dependent RNA circularization protein (DNA/RNA ligase family)
MRRKPGMRSIVAMSDVLHKFPSTPHLVWLGQDPVRDDKVMGQDEVVEFLSHPIIVEEKVDGANLGISVGSDGRLRFQNRGNWLTGTLTGQWERLRGWAARHEIEIQKVLPTGHVLFGEWCYAQHSIHYGGLADLFLVFDVYDDLARKFWSASRRDALAKKARLATVPRIAAGIFRAGDLLRLLDDTSAYGDARREGIYLRREKGDWLVERAKIVAPEFTQAIAEHWTRGPMIVNEVANLGYGENSKL